MVSRMLAPPKSHVDSDATHTMLATGSMIIVEHQIAWTVGVLPEPVDDPH